jgi:hypothetical protein
VRHYDPPITMNFRDSWIERIHAIRIHAWNLASDVMDVEDVCCGNRSPLSSGALEMGTRVPWKVNSVEEADAWMSARAALGLVSVFL